MKQQTDNRIQQVLDTIRHTEGLEHLLELSFGCLLRNKHTPSDDGYYVYVRPAKRGTWSVLRTTFGDFGDWDSDSFKIIGHPVQWSDVLVAIGDNAVASLGIEHKLNVGRIGQPEIFYQFDLLKTPEQNMHDNPELLDFLEDLLIKKL